MLGMLILTNILYCPTNIYVFYHLIHRDDGIKKQIKMLGYPYICCLCSLQISYTLQDKRYTISKQGQKVVHKNVS